MHHKTDRFISELETAQFVQRIALERYNAEMTIAQAHECWQEHSDDYCASWLKLDSENPCGEACRSLIKWQEQHGKLPLANAAYEPTRQKTLNENQT